MATLTVQQVFQCDQCGNPDIVAVPLFYQEGTRTFSGIFSRGVSQSVAAQALAPPRRRSYARRLLPWMFAVVFTTIATSFDLNTFVRRPAFSISEAGLSLIFSLSLASVWGLTRGFLRTLRYNREVYSKLE